MEPMTRGCDGAVGSLQHEGVQAVLRIERLLHGAVRGQRPDAADRPAGAPPCVQQPVHVHRLVGAMEPADAEVHDAASRGRCARSVGRRHGVAETQRLVVQRWHLWNSGWLGERTGEVRDGRQALQEARRRHVGLPTSRSASTGYWRLRPRNDTDDKARPAGALSPLAHGGEGGKVTDVVPDVEQGLGVHR